MLNEPKISGNILHHPKSILDMYINYTHTHIIARSRDKLYDILSICNQLAMCKISETGIGHSTNWQIQTVCVFFKIKTHLKNTWKKSIQSESIWNLYQLKTDYDGRHLIFTSLHPIGSRQLPAIHLWLVHLAVELCHHNFSKTRMVPARKLDHQIIIVQPWMKPGLLSDNARFSHISL